MYNRGGKVWVGNEGNGLVFLEKDWDHSRLPEDLVEEAGLLGTDFELLNPEERAMLGGYICSDESIIFCTDIPQSDHDYSTHSVFLAWEGNDWLSSNENIQKWELTKTEDSRYLLKLPIDLISDFKEFFFKFKTSEELWIDPPDFIPCKKESMPGVWNFHYNKQRTGNDILRFRLIEKTSSNSIDKWLSSSPDNLGATRNEEKWTFRLFAPRAKNVELLMYSQREDPLITSMRLTEEGIWQCSKHVEECGYSYHFRVTHSDNLNDSSEFSKIILDPYAKACFGREGPGLLIHSPKRKTPKEIYNPPEIKDLVIVETHIRDILAKAPVNISDQERKGFVGLTKWLQSENCYLRKLGANAVELQPIQQFDSRKKDDYHWGYMPVNYFSPASDYATSPENSVQEVGQMIEALHDAGLAVILDVVYNHMGIPNHLLNIDRELYLMTDELGRLTNHSGCGNDLRCEATPVKKLIIDSLKYWIETFDVDGFRFDLGELLGFELLDEIELELRKIKPGTILIAEPWSFRGRLPSKMDQTGYSLWSDRSRESLLSFIQSENNAENIKRMMQGKLDHENSYPWQSIQYCESHDDYAFIDRICSDNDEGGLKPSDEAIGKAQLAMAVLLLSPGVPMISAGQDFLRSKKGIRNTYQHGEINALDYERSEEFKDFSQEIRNLISFRLSERGKFTRPHKYEDCSYTDIDCKNSKTIAFSVIHKSSSEEFLFLGNPSSEKSKIDLPTDWIGAEPIFPISKEITPESHLLPWEYRLFARRLK